MKNRSIQIIHIYGHGQEAVTSLLVEKISTQQPLLHFQNYSSQRGQHIVSMTKGHKIVCICCFLSDGIFGRKILYKPKLMPNI